jgi:hypothetical protein
MDRQIIYFIEKITKEKSCSNNPNIYLPDIYKLLSSNRGLSGYDMNNLSCLMNKILFSCESKHSNKYGIRRPNNDLKKWFKKFEKINVESTISLVYDAYLTDTKSVIMKTPRNRQFIGDLFLEYMIGVYAINSLRYKIPTFIYTFAIFSAPPQQKKTKTVSFDIDMTSLTNDTVYLVTEKASGESMSSANKTMSFEEWLIIFMQILISLELSQREIQFTHFDLHTNNVMVCKDEPVEYAINFDDNTYSVHNTYLKPVFIDFGSSTAKIDNFTIGNDEYIVILVSTHTTQTVTIRISL